VEKITIREILTATGGKLISGNEDTIINDITTDSRKAEPGVLFVALKGDNFDGNDFADEFLKGGEAVVVEKDLTPISGKGIIRVDDTKKALRDIAKYYRGKFNIPVIGVTGSVGKTSTKDMLASVLSQKYSTLKTQGNFNNEIGLPLTVFNLTKENEVAVIEMGMNNFGEISRLTNIAQPSIAVITNIGTAHIGNLGSQQNILKAKLEILEKLIPNGIVVLNGDDKILYSLKGKLPHTVIYYGIDNLKADIVATNIILGADKSKFKVRINGKIYPFEVNIIGQHHIYNALAAIIVGLQQKVEIEKIIKGVAEFSSGSMRQSIEKIDGITLIEDCYNASSASMEAALKVLSQIGGANRTIAVLGDILEQGDYSEKAHRQVGLAVAEFEINKLITVGSDSKYIADEAKKRGIIDIISFDNNIQATEYLISEVKKDDTVWFKASRGMKLEEISNGLKEHLR